MTLKPQAAPALVPLSSKRPAIDVDGPRVPSPSRMGSPPPPPDRQRLHDRSNLDRASSKGSRHSGRFTDRISINGVDPELLSRRLSRDIDADRRDSASAASPSGKRRRINGDRFIPSRSGQDLQASYSLLHDESSPTSRSRKKRIPHGELQFQKTEEANRTFSHLLRAELFEDTVPSALPPEGNPRVSTHSTHIHDPTPSHTPPCIPASPPPPAAAPSPSVPSSFTPSTPHKNLFQYMSPRHHIGHPTPSRTPQSRHGPNLDTGSEIYSLSPVRDGSQRMLLYPAKQPRVVDKVPVKVLDAPELADDFYLNLVDWGSSNKLGVALGPTVYVWDATTAKPALLCQLNDDIVTSVSWIQKGTHLAIGTGKGLVQIWDVEKTRRLRTMTGHTARVGALAWNSHILTSGSRDRMIYHRDVRAPEQWEHRLAGHKQEVCGLKWNGEGTQLASGGNDNKLIVWEKTRETPLWRLTEHRAAVKAIAWSPHQRNLLASGGGTVDRRILFHDTAQGTLLQDVDTGSQVCNIAWSKNSNELVSTHGYSQNQIVVWKYPSMRQVVNLTGHTYRVLYLAMSPDGRTIVTGAGDETLRFWNLFGRRRHLGEQVLGGTDRFCDVIR
ncbi:WD40-repeat-containing domain protein [Xylariaceae sp. FL0594]|nr:WD40-repeat-containing domain protein [Xylariaceae sp. FL0594]